MDEKQAVENTGKKLHEKVMEDQAVHCPSCGRYVGAYDRCPYCQAEMKYRMDVRWVKRSVVIGSIVGLVLLWLAAKLSEVPAMEIGTIGANHNMALVKLQGIVTGSSVQEEKNTFRLTLDDGTGTISLGGFGKLDRFRDAFKEDFPGIGDRIEVIGNLSISEQWGATMFLSIPSRLKMLQKYEVKEAELADITLDDVNETYIIEAEVTGHRQFGSGYSIQLRDGNASMELSLFERQYESIPEGASKEMLFEPGSVFEMVVTVDRYEEECQLKLKNPENPENLVFLEKREYNTESLLEEKREYLSDILLKPVGSWAVIEVKTVESRQIENVGRSLQVTDDTDTMTFFVYDGIFNGVENGEKMMDTGARFRARVKVSEFRGKPQLLLENPKEILFLDEVKN